MIAWNVTGFKVEAKAGGEEYLFEPFSEADIYDLAHLDHVLRENKDYGIVGLIYGPQMKAKFTKFEDYKKAQEILGLQRCLNFWQRVLLDEEQAMRDAKKDGSEMDKSLTKIEEFETKIDYLKIWLKDDGFSAKEERKLESDSMKRPDWKKNIEPEREVKKEKRTEVNELRTNEDNK